MLLYHTTTAMRVQPDWPKLCPSPLSDAASDGVMVGLHAVSCGVMTINGKWPKWSPVPAAAQDGLKLWQASSVEVHLDQYRVFLMHKQKRGRGVKTTHLLMCSVNDPVEQDFSAALLALSFVELTAPDFGGYFPNGHAPSFSGHQWLMISLLSDVRIGGWHQVRKKTLFQAEPRREEPQEYPTTVDMLTDWLHKVARVRNRRTDAFPDRFQIFEEPTWEEREMHRRAARLLANLPTLFQRALEVLQDVDIDIVTASESAIASALRKHKMPRLCITCLNKLSLQELIKHLVKTTLAGDSHIYSLDALKEDRELVREKIAEGTEEAFMLKVVCAVKLASLIQLPAWAWMAIGREIRAARAAQREAERLRNEAQNEESE